MILAPVPLWCPYATNERTYEQCSVQTAFAAGSGEREPPAGAAAVENCPLQMVSTGNAEDDYSFKLCEDNLDRVLSKVY